MSAPWHGVRVTHCVDREKCNSAPPSQLFLKDLVLLLEMWVWSEAKPRQPQWSSVLWSLPVKWPKPPRQTPLCGIAAAAAAQPAPRQALPSWVKPVERGNKSEDVLGVWIRRESFLWPTNCWHKPMSNERHAASEQMCSSLQMAISPAISAARRNGACP